MKLQLSVTKRELKDKERPVTPLIGTKSYYGSCWDMWIGPKLFLVQLHA